MGSKNMGLEAPYPAEMKRKRRPSLALRAREGEDLPRRADSAPPPDLRSAVLRTAMARKGIKEGSLRGRVLLALHGPRLSVRVAVSGGGV